MKPSTVLSLAAAAVGAGGLHLPEPIPVDPEQLARQQAESLRQLTAAQAKRDRRKAKVAAMAPLEMRQMVNAHNRASHASRKGTGVMRYPKECPVFEIVRTDGDFVPNGTVGEGIEVGECIPTRYGKYVGVKAPAPEYENGGTAIGIRIPDHRREVSVARHPDGWAGVLIHCSRLRPLTPAAVEMLAIARRM